MPTLKTAQAIDHVIELAADEQFDYTGGYGNKTYRVQSIVYTIHIDADGTLRSNVKLHGARVLTGGKISDSQRIGPFVGNFVRTYPRDVADILLRLDLINPVQHQFALAGLSEEE